MRIVWSPQSLVDRDAIWEYIASHSPAAAARVDADFDDAVDRLAEYPDMGKVGVVAGTRELFPIYNYRIVYELSGDEIWILAIVHTSRLWPR